MGATKPLISVVMPVHNGAFYLSDCLDSIAAQDVSETYELVVIDDCSNDSTREILTRYRDRIRHMAIIRTHTTVGPASARNIGLRKARGAFIATMDADDICDVSRLRVQYEYMRSHNKVGLVGSHAMMIDATGKYLYLQRYPLSDEVIKYRLVIPDKTFCHPSTMMRRELVDRIGGYTEHMQSSVDYDLYTRMMWITKFGNLDVPLLYYRVHDRQVSEVSRHRQKYHVEEITVTMLEKLLGSQIDRYVVRQILKLDAFDAGSWREVVGVFDDVYAALVARGIIHHEKNLVRREVSEGLADIVHWRRASLADAQVLAKSLRYGVHGIGRVLARKVKSACIGVKRKDLPVAT